MEEEFLRIWKIVEESLLYNMKLLWNNEFDWVLKDLSKKPFKLAKNLSKYIRFKRDQKRAFKSITAYPKEAINAFEEWRAYIHDYYNSSHEKLFNFAIDAFEEMEETATEKLVSYCATLWINSDAQEYGDFVIKQLNHTLNSYHDNSFLSHRYDEDTLSPRGMIQLYLNNKNQYIPSINHSITSWYEEKKIDVVKSNTIHEWEHYFQYWLDGNWILLPNNRKSSVKWWPLYRKALEDIRPFMHQVTLHSRFYAVETHKEIDNTLARVWKSIMDTLAPKERFYYQNTIEILARIRQSQAFVDEIRWDTLLSEKRFNQIISQSQKYNKFAPHIIDNVRKGEVENLSNWINNDFF